MTASNENMQSPTQVSYLALLAREKAKTRKERQLQAHLHDRNPTSTEHVTYKALEIITHDDHFAFRDDQTLPSESEFLDEIATAIRTAVGLEGQMKSVSYWHEAYSNLESSLEGSSVRDKKLMARKIILDDISSCTTARQGEKPNDTDRKGILISTILRALGLLQTLN